MTTIISEIKDGFKTKAGKQTLVLFISQMVLIIFGFLVTAANTRILTPEGFGAFTFIMSIIAFCLIFFHFGFSSTATLMLAEAKSKKRERELIGAFVAITLILGVFFSAFMFLFSFIIDDFFRTNVGGILRLLSPLLAIYPFQMLIQQMGKGMNRIHSIAAYNVLPPAIYLSLLLVAWGKLDVGVTEAAFFTAGSVIIASAAILSRFSPSFGSLRANLVRIWAKNKEYGIHLYVGQIADQSTFNLDKLLIMYFVGATWTGFYALALILTRPMTILSNSLSTTLFRGFVKSDRVSKRVIGSNLAWLLACAIIIVLAGPHIIPHMFTSDFAPAAVLILPLALAALLHGMYLPFNAFLGAKGRGKWLRNVSLLMAGVNLFGNMLLIPLFGAYGAALATLAGRGVYFMFCLLYYVRLRGSTT